MVQKTSFFSSLKSTLREPKISADIAHLATTKKQVYNAFIAQSIQKASGLDKIKFKILYMIWNWEAKQINKWYNKLYN